MSDTRKNKVVVPSPEGPADRIDYLAGCALAGIWAYQGPTGPHDAQAFHNDAVTAYLMAAQMAAARLEVEAALGIVPIEIPSLLHDTPDLEPATLLAPNV